MAAGNVFFRDLGNVEGHVLRLWWFLSPGLYSLAALDDLRIFKEHPALRTLAGCEPVRDPVRGLPEGHLRDADDGTRRGPAELRLAGGPARREPRSSSALTTIVFKRLEPNFAKVI